MPPIGKFNSVAIFTLFALLFAPLSLAHDGKIAGGLEFEFYSAPNEIPRAGTTTIIVFNAKNASNESLHHIEAEVKIFKAGDPAGKHIYFNKLHGHAGKMDFAYNFKEEGWYLLEFLVRPDLTEKDHSEFEPVTVQFQLQATKTGSKEHDEGPRPSGIPAEVAILLVALLVLATAYLARKKIL